MSDVIKYENTKKNHVAIFLKKIRIVVYVLFVITILIFNILILGNNNQRLDTSTTKYIDKNKLPPTQ